VNKGPGRTDKIDALFNLVLRAAKGVPVYSSSAQISDIICLQLCPDNGCKALIINANSQFVSSASRVPSMYGSIIHILTTVAVPAGFCDHQDAYFLDINFEKYFTCCTRASHNDMRTDHPRMCRSHFRDDVISARVPRASCPSRSTP
jgi:hypothetical protein